MTDSVIAHHRPASRYAWPGSALRIVDDEGRAGTAPLSRFYFRGVRFLRDRWTAGATIPGSVQSIRGAVRPTFRRTWFRSISPTIQIMLTGDACHSVTGIARQYDLRTRGSR